MQPVPAPCQSYADLIAALEAELDALRREAGDEGRPKDEPFGPGEKEAVNRRINKVREGIRTAQRQLTECVYEQEPPPADTVPALEVAGIEVNQGVQEDFRSASPVRLVRGRATVVRVFVASGVSNGFDAGAGRNKWPHITGDLLVTDPATGMAGAPLQPVTPGGEIVAVPRHTISSLDLTRSLNFRLPLSAVNSPTIELRARVWVRGHHGQGGGWNAERTLTVDLLPRGPQEITPLLLIDVGNNSPAPTPATFNRLLRRGALSRLPVPFFQVNSPITLPVLQNLNSLPGWFAMTAGLATASFFGRRSGGIRAGLLSADLAGYPVGGMGIPRVWFTAPAFISTPGEDMIAHEMGHTHGMNHAQCRGSEPWPHDTRLPGRCRSLGLHVEDLLQRPPGTPELMGYCSAPTWPSREGYDIVFDNPA